MGSGTKQLMGRKRLREDILWDPLVLWGRPQLVFSCSVGDETDGVDLGDQRVKGKVLHEANLVFWQASV